MRTGNIINMKFRNPFQSATDRLISKELEHQLYEKASIDIENNNINDGVWTKAFSKAGGDEVKQKAIYIELMVEHYRDEIRAGEEIAKVLATEANKEKERQRQEEIERQERERERKADAERDKKLSEEQRKYLEYLDSPEGKKQKKWVVVSGMLAILFLITLFWVASIAQ